MSFTRHTFASLVTSSLLLASTAQADVRIGQHVLETLNCSGITAYGTHVSLSAMHDENHLLTGIRFSEKQYGLGTTQETARGYQTVVPVTEVREIVLTNLLADVEGPGRLSLLRSEISSQFNHLPGKRMQPAESFRLFGFTGLDGLNAHVVIHTSPDEDEGQQIQLHCEF